MEDVFNSSVRLITVCMSLIMVTQIIDGISKLFINEILCLASALFIMAMMVSHVFLCDEHRFHFKKLAVGFFILGLATLTLAGILLIIRLQSATL